MGVAKHTRRDKQGGRKLRPPRLLLPEYLQNLPSISITLISLQRKLPVVSAVYFIYHSRFGLLYIGRASNLRSRWYPKLRSDDLRQVDFTYSHHCMADALVLRGSRLYWQEVERPHLHRVETHYIRALAPAWNVAHNAGRSQLKPIESTRKSIQIVVSPWEGNRVCKNQILRIRVSPWDDY